MMLEDEVRMYLLGAEARKERWNDLKRRRPKAQMQMRSRVCKSGEIASFLRT